MIIMRHLSLLCFVLFLLYGFGSTVATSSSFIQEKTVRPMQSVKLNKYNPFTVSNESEANIALNQTLNVINDILKSCEEMNKATEAVKSNVTQSKRVIKDIKTAMEKYINSSFVKNILIKANNNKSTTQSLIKAAEQINKISSEAKREVNKAEERVQLALKESYHALSNSTRAMEKVKKVKSNIQSISINSEGKSNFKEFVKKLNEALHVSHNSEIISLHAKQRALRAKEFAENLQRAAEKAAVRLTNVVNAGKALIIEINNNKTEQILPNVSLSKEEKATTAVNSLTSNKTKKNLQSYSTKDDSRLSVCVHALILIVLLLISLMI